MTFNLDLGISVIKFQSLDWLAKIFIISTIHCMQADIILCLCTVLHLKGADKMFL